MFYYVLNQIIVIARKALRLDVAIHNPRYFKNLDHKIKDKAYPPPSNFSKRTEQRELHLYIKALQVI